MTDQDDSRLASNFLLFCRTLRAAGIPLGPARILDALRAVAAVGLERQDDVCAALRSSLLSDPAHFRLFEQAFHVYFQNPRLLQRLAEMLLPTINQDAASDDASLRRLAEALGTRGMRDGDEPDDRGAVDVLSYSAIEKLRSKDFEQMSLREQREARALLLADIQPLKKLPSRRFCHRMSGKHYDLRRTMQLMIRNDGQPLVLARKSRQSRPPVLVLICDISASMSQYSRMFLLFAHAMAAREQAVHSFVFGTQLSNISRHLADRDADASLARIAEDVFDWEGGTRIASALRRFNIDWGRRTLSQNAVVVLLSDGLERDTHADLALEMQRLHRSCRQLIWLNPLLRFSDFAPRAFGIRTMLPHVDRLVSAHNVNSLVALGRLLNEGEMLFKSSAVRQAAA